MFLKEADDEIEKCEKIQNRMNAFTQVITYLLYRNYKNNITYDNVMLCIRTTFVYRKQKVEEDKCDILARNIIDFLNNNGIIESDEGYPDRYYFTLFGNKYIHYFMNRII